MDGQGGVVGFDDGVGDLGGRYNGEGFHDSIRVFLSNLGDQKGSHSGSSTTSQRVGNLESLETVTSFGFLSDDVQDGIDQFSSFGVVTFGPVVSGSGLSEHEVVGSEQLSEGSGSDGVHGSGFQVHQDGSGDVSSSSGFVVINVSNCKSESPW